MKPTIKQNIYSVPNFKKTHLVGCDSQISPVWLVEITWNLLSSVSAKFCVIFPVTPVRKIFGNFLESVSRKRPRDILECVSVKVSQVSSKLCSGEFPRDSSDMSQPNFLELSRLCLVEHFFFLELLSSVPWRNFLDGSRWMFSEILSYVSEREICLNFLVSTCSDFLKILSHSSHRIVLKYIFFSMCLCEFPPKFLRKWYREFSWNVLGCLNA